ncbi:LUD domain-containing protein [Belliella sp. DSM 111904]|uniref:LUD domain-containing protein n=1 Tax=Belliella filtrata TaxID=2923435 RepID=A0ABS9UYX0_9BACT|nr:LUD domain-containing protein [Belliella filtrata]MCH7409366.1 LUD domain-containing protein [Belliella filtrata]
MSSKASIIASIKEIPLEATELPEIPRFEFSGNLTDNFSIAISNNKGAVISQTQLDNFITSNGITEIIALSAGFDAYNSRTLPSNPHELDNLQLAIIQGQLGVAENGAIWLTDENMGLRALPFITEHLVIVLPKNSLVPFMHEAYEIIGDQQSGFGLFVAGPSKTADIEQSLVIGAHGAKSLQVILI